MRGSARAEVVKLVRRPAVWVLVGVWITLSNAFGYLFPYLAYREARDDPEPGGVPAEVLLGDLSPANLVANSVAGLPMFGGAIVLILGVLLTGSEYGWNTLKTIFTQGPRRFTLFGGKLVVVGAMTFVLMAVTFVVGALFGGLITAGEGQAVDWPSAADLAQGFAAGWLMMLMWGLFGMALGVLFQGPALGVGLGLVWALVIENLTRGLAELLSVFDALQKMLPGTNSGALAASLGALTQDGDRGTPGVVDVVSGTQATIVLACYVVGFAVIASLVLRRRDVA